MRICKDFRAALREVDAYVSHFDGAPLIVAVDDAKQYGGMLGCLRADSDKEIVRVSASCFGEFPPNPNMMLGKVSDAARRKNVVWVGASQAVMLHSQNETEAFIIKLAGTSFPGPVIVLCPYLCGMLQSLSGRYEKLSRTFVTIPAVDRVIPSVNLYGDASLCPVGEPVMGMKALISALEDGVSTARIAFISSCRAEWIAASMFPLGRSMSPYEALCEREPGIQAFTERTDGTDAQWSAIAKKLAGKTFAEVCEEAFGSLKQLPLTMGTYLDASDMGFLCYIGLKVYARTEGSYLSECLKQCNGPEDLIGRLYNAILSVDPHDRSFEKWMTERHALLQSFEEDHALIQDYCDRATMRERDVLYYLSADTEAERAAIIHALCVYKYSDDELNDRLRAAAPELALYLRRFVFDAFNTKVMEADAYIRQLLTDYMDSYKRQKLTNAIEPDFLKIVETEAVRRSFTKLQTRAAVVRRMDKSNVTPFFFDALGVEFLGYIEAKCEEYELQFDCQIARCDLPSITSVNRDFYGMFPEDSIRKESGLDDVKHEGTYFDYRATKEPLHIFDELAVLDRNLKKFAAWLKRGAYEKIVILSDHGASRLAVIHESENDRLELPEKGKHSGRCCPCDHDPGIPFAYYEAGSGYAVLANYERFKGSRKADVETHGGASLEETVIPIITLSARPKEQQVFFVEDTVQCNARTGTEIKLYANPPLNSPRLVVRETSYNGIFDGDKHIVAFTMPEIKRKGHYEAEVYDGSKRIASLSFDAIRATRVNDGF